MEAERSQFVQRFEQVLKVKKIDNYRKFERECSISNNQINNLLQTGRCRTDIFAAIMMHPLMKDIDIRWLLTGENGSEGSLRTEVDLLKQQFADIHEKIQLLDQLKKVTLSVQETAKKKLKEECLNNALVEV